jgi:transcriptional regulator with GAF, ATPase, and Fis domain
VKKDEFFREATLRIFSSLDAEAALFRTMKYLNEFMPLEGIVLHFPRAYRFSPIVSVTCKQGGETFDHDISLPADVLRAFRVDEIEDYRTGVDDYIKIFNNALENPEMKPEICMLVSYVFQRPVSLINLYLKVESSYVGTLSFYTGAENSYTTEHAELLRLLKEPLSMALLNIRRFERLRDIKDDLAEDNEDLHLAYSELHDTEIVGSKTGLRRIMTSVRQVAGMDCTVLVLGETGVGKEVIARALHNFSVRKDKPFISLNCGAIPEKLIDSELFGHERGAFTGAESSRKGFFERAGSGTIFLDEIGELPLPAQVRLLRVIQEMTIERVGGTAPIPVGARIIAATNRNLKQMVDTGTFRGDLWYRLNVFPLTVPALRDRKEDIPELVLHFIRKKSNEMKLGFIPTISSETIRKLGRYEWPGNIRELENMVERALIQLRGSSSKGSLHFELFSDKDPGQISIHGVKIGQPHLKYDEYLAACIESVLQQTRGKIYGAGAAAEILDINPGTLRSKMQKLGIPFGQR